MKVICFSYTDRGAEIASKLEALSKSDYSFTHHRSKELDGGVKGCLLENWNLVDGFVFISATGIAVRMISPFIKDKKTDPAIIVIDDMGNYVISLLSGHLGGANLLANYISEKINSQPIITTATDNRGIEAIDLFAQKKDYRMRNMKDITKLTTMMVDNKKIGYYSEDTSIINYNNIIRIKKLNNLPDYIEGLIVVSSKDDLGQIPLPYCQLVPKNINIGIGCRRGTEKEKILEAIDLEFKENNLLKDGIKSIGSVEVKKDEVGLLEAVDFLGKELEIFTIESIEKVEDMFDKSDFVKKTIGVYSVSEPVAYLLGGNLIVKKAIHSGITLSIAKEGEI